VAGYKLVQEEKKPIAAFIIEMDEKAVGYIQYYAASDFLEGTLLNYLPKNMTTVDNAAAIACYQRAGFQFYSENPDQRVMDAILSR
jgi:hypothetical protein